MEPTISYELKSKLAARAIPTLTPAQVDAAAVAIAPYPGGFAGRGITVCAGGFRYFTNAWVLIRMLRKLGCELPVQFWYYGEGEMDGKMRKLVEPYGVECVDARRKAEEVGCRLSQGWPLKPFSILHSPFEEVLALDADNMPIRNPEYLFESAGYRETGAIFWPDVGRTAPGSAIWKLMGVPFRPEPEFESGQIVVNKALAWEPLNLAMWLNEEGRADFIYKIIWGDKDTFRFAWHKFGFPFAMTPVPLQMLSVVGGPCCSGVMCQHDLEGERIFQHRNLLKWQLFEENPWVPGFLFEGECREFLAELRAKWNGRIGAPTGRPSSGAAEWMRKLRETVWLLETTGGPAAGVAVGAALPDGRPAEVSPAVAGDLAWPEPRQRKAREVRFLPGGHCGRWSGPQLSFWEVREEAAGLRLHFAGNGGADVPTAKLKLHADGSWRGHSVGGKEKAKLRLMAVQDTYPSANVPGVRRGGSAVRPVAPCAPARKIHVFNSAKGIGDHVTALYACVGAVNAGYDVVFHTRFPQWMQRVAHPGLTITWDAVPEASPTRRVVDVNHDPAFQQRYAGSRARWYGDAILPDLAPARPATINREIGVPRFDFDRYVVLAPFSAWARRDWPGANWTRLTHLLREAGYEVVAIGLGGDKGRFETVFGPTTALWAVDHRVDWIADAMLGAACVIGNDSGMAHVAGLLGVPVVALHAHLPGEFLFSHAAVTSLTPKTDCTFCRWQPDRGYNTACDSACSALATIGPEEVLRAVKRVARTVPRRVRAPIEQMAEPEVPPSGVSRLDPAVVAHAEAVGWQKYYPILTDEEVAVYEARGSRKDRQRLDEFFAVEKIINRKPSGHVLATSLFWKNVDAGDPELPRPTMHRLKNAQRLGLVKRYEPWAHYVEPLLRGAEKLAQERPDVTVRVYLAKDLEFLVPQLAKHCEVYLMRHSSLRHNPGAMWRFLALGDAEDCVTVMDADALDTGAHFYLGKTDELLAGGVLSWRQPYHGIGPWESNQDRHFLYRPMIACGFGSRVNVAIEPLMKAFVWHYERGNFAQSVRTPEGRELRHFQNLWPGYSADEWFLSTTLYPRLLPFGFLTNDRVPLASAVSLADDALVSLTHPQSRRIEA